MSKDVRVNLAPLTRLVKAFTPGTRPFDRLMKRWAYIYRAFARRQFVKQSRGGGGWVSLASSTKKRRRKARKGHQGSRSFAILRDTGTLFAALNPTIKKPGSYEKPLPDGVRIGFGGPARHPKGKATIADIAYFHDQGQGVPQRRILVDPDDKTRALMALAMERLAEEEYRD
jgi:hypothetical protein